MDWRAFHIKGKLASPGSSRTMTFKPVCDGAGGGRVTARYRKGIIFCILALGSGQHLLYRLGSGVGLVLVLVLWCNAIVHTFAIAALCDSRPESGSILACLS